MDGSNYGQNVDRPYWADTYMETAPHVFRRLDGEGGAILSAERTWAHLRENRSRQQAFLAEAA